MFQEGLLQGVESFRTGQALDSGNLSAVGFNSKYQAGINDSAIQGNSARTTIAVVAALLGASESEDVSKNFQQTLAGFAEEIYLVAIDVCLYVTWLGQPNSPSVGWLAGRGISVGVGSICIAEVDRSSLVGFRVIGGRPLEAVA